MTGATRVSSRAAAPARNPAPLREARRADGGGQPSLGDELAWRLDAFNKFLLTASPVVRVTGGIAREVCRALGFTRALFLHTDAGTGQVKCGAGHGVDPSFLQRSGEPQESTGWVARCASAGRPDFTLNARHGPAVPLGYVEALGLGPLLCVPVTGSSASVALVLLDRRGSFFRVSEELLCAAGCVGASLGLALEAARSYGGMSPAGEELPVLSSRQRQMLVLLGRGLSNKEIATATGLSVFTVRDYVSSLLRCLGVGCRSAAVARAWELGLLDFEHQ